MDIDRYFKVYGGGNGFFIYFFERLNSLEIPFLPLEEDIVPLDYLHRVKDFEFNAFGIPISKKVILEAYTFMKKQDDKFSFFVNRFSFIQLIVIYYITIKLYEKYTLLYKNKSYEDFIKIYFYINVNNVRLNIIYFVDTLLSKGVDYAKDSGISFSNMMNRYYKYDIYNIIYGIFPRGVSTLLHNISNLQFYMPLKSYLFFYNKKEFKLYEKAKELIKSANELLAVARISPKEMYGNPRDINEAKLLKSLEYVKDPLEFLSLENMNINDLFVSKAKDNTYGIGYDEIGELLWNKYEINTFTSTQSQAIGYKFHKIRDCTIVTQEYIDKELAEGFSSTIAQLKSFCPTTKEATDEIFNRIQASHYIITSNLIPKENVFEYIERYNIDVNFSQYDGPTSSELATRTFMAYRVLQGITMGFINAYD